MDCSLGFFKSPLTHDADYCTSFCNIWKAKSHNINNQVQTTGTLYSYFIYKGFQHSSSTISGQETSSIIKVWKVLSFHGWWIVCTRHILWFSLSWSINKKLFQLFSRKIVANCDPETTRFPNPMPFNLKKWLSKLTYQPQSSYGQGQTIRCSTGP